MRKVELLFNRRGRRLGAISFALALALLMMASGVSASGPTITTGLSDYEPGDTVTFTGSGFAAGEVVNLLVVGSTNGSQVTSQTTADQDGSINGSFDLPIMFEATYSLTVTGADSGLQATTSFYDFVSAFNIVSPASPVSLSAGVIQTYTILAKTQGNNVVPGLTVNWTSTGGTMNPASSITGSDGKASSDYKAGSTAGLYQVTATAAGAGQNGSDKVSTQSVTIVNSDSIAPTTTASATSNEASYTFGNWTNHDVAVTLTATDNNGGSGVASTEYRLNSGSWIGYSDPFTVTTEGTTAVDYRSTDNAGNIETYKTATIKIDKTAPAIVQGTTVGTLGSNGWYKSDVTVNFTASDGLSGLLNSADASFSLTTSGEGSSVSTGSRDVYDNAGNKSTAGPLSFMVDKTAPSLNISGATSGTYSVCSIPIEPTFDPSDSLSGIASQSESWTPSSTPSGVGTYVYTASATDGAGNSTSETRTFIVNYSSSFGGFLQPIRADGLSRFKLGSTVPVKFQLLCGGTSIANAVAKLYVAQGDNVPDPGVDEAISTSASTTGNLFRYDSTSLQYIFNLSTKAGYTNPDETVVSFSPGTWTLKILLDDGSWHSVNIQIFK